MSHCKVGSPPYLGGSPIIKKLYYSLFTIFFLPLGVI